MGRRTTCGFPHCAEPVDKDRDCGLCSEHSQRWLASDTFLGAAKDDRVAGYALIGATRCLKRELAKHRRRWAEAEAAREDGEADSDREVAS